MTHAALAKSLHGVFRRHRWRGLCAAALVLSGCASPPPVSDPQALRVTRVNATTVQLTAPSGHARQTLATSAQTLLLPTHLSPDAVAYLELTQGGANIFILSLAGGARHEGRDDAAILQGCAPEVQAARAARAPGAAVPWSDALASRPAQGACLAAFRQHWSLARHASALRQLREGRYAEANAAFVEFTHEFPDSALVASALFNAGVADYFQGRHRPAAELFRRGASASAAPAQAADALLAAADCDVELGDRAQLEADLAELVRRHPGTPGAAVARQRLDDARAPRGTPGADVPAYQPRMAILSAPSYPAMSKRLGETGRVVVKVAIGTNGTVEEAVIAVGSGYPRLDQAALDNARGNRFFPARSRSGTKVRVHMDQPIQFKLN